MIRLLLASLTCFFLFLGCGGDITDDTSEDLELAPETAQTTAAVRGPGDPPPFDPHLLFCAANYNNDTEFCRWLVTVGGSQRDYNECMQIAQGNFLACVGASQLPE